MAKSHITESKIPVLVFLGFTLFVELSASRISDEAFTMLADNVTALTRRMDEFEARQSSAQEDITQLSSYVGIVGELISRHLETEKKVDQVLEFKHEMQSVRRDVDGIMNKIQELENNLSSPCQKPEVVMKMEAMTQAVHAVQSTVVDLCDASQIRQGIDAVKYDLQELKRNVSNLIVKNDIFENVLSASVRDIEVLKAQAVRALDSERVHFMELSERINVAERSTQFNLTGLETGLKQTISAVNKTLSAETSAFQRSMSRFDHMLTSGLSQIQGIETRISQISDTVNRISTKVAFHTLLSTSIGDLTHNMVVKFDEVKTNIGQGYEPSTGVFRCPVNGIYVFAVTIVAYPHKGLELMLTKNGDITDLIYAWSSSDKFDSGSKIAIIQLQAGDNVSVQVHHSYYETGPDLVIDQWFTTFSGFLLN